MFQSIKKAIISYKTNAYFQVNILITGILLLLFLYSGIFSSSGIPHPVKSAFSEPTISTGISRAFSEIIRGKFTKALQLNPYSLSIFTFFFIQFIIRIIIVILLLSSIKKQKVLIITDILLAVLLFLLTFFRFIIDQL